MWIRILIGIFIFIIITAVGIIEQCVLINKRKKELDFLIEYFDRVTKFYQEDYSQYTYLMEYFDKAQLLLGVNGILASLRLPYENVYHQHVPILTLLLEMSKARGTSTHEYYRMLSQAFLRTIGDYKQYQEQAINNLKKIYIGFYRGFYLIIATPFIMISYMFFRRNIFILTKLKPFVSFFSIISGLIQLIAIIAGIITIVLGWSEFKNLINQIF